MKIANYLNPFRGVGVSQSRNQINNIPKAKKEQVQEDAVKVDSSVTRDDQSQRNDKKIADIKRQVENGSYRVDSKGVASALVKELFL